MAHVPPLSPRDPELCLFWAELCHSLALLFSSLGIVSIMKSNGEGTLVQRWAAGRLSSTRSLRLLEQPAADWGKWLNPEYCKPSSRPPAEGNLNSPDFLVELKLFGCKPDFLSICLPLWALYSLSALSQILRTSQQLVLWLLVHFIDKLGHSKWLAQGNVTNGWKHIDPPILAQWFFSLLRKLWFI